MNELPQELLTDMVEHMEARLNTVMMHHEMMMHGVLFSQGRLMVEQHKIERFEKKWLPSPLTLAEQTKY